MKRREKKLGFSLRAAAAAVALLIAISGGGTAFAQKRGGILKMYSPDSPPTMSILEEATLTSQAPMMGVFNNLVMFDQHVKQDSLKSIVPDLATGWNWNEDGTEVTFPLRQGVRWHDGKPFTAADIVCTWDLLMEKSQEKLRFNPRKSFYKNLDQVTVNGDYEVTFHLKRPQPAFVMLLASGFSAIYPCDVPPAQMRQHPIGTGPFKFVEFKPNEFIKVVKNPDYWKPGLPYLDPIEYTLLHNRSTAILAFVAGKYELTFAGTLTIPLTRDLQRQRPDAVCDVPPYRDPAVILIDQLKEIYIDGELEPIDTAQWYPKVQRKDYAVALNLTGTLVDDPDAMLYENYACGGVGNYNGYCNPEIDRMIEQQSMEADQEKRKRLVWEIERRLTEDDAKPLIYFNRGGVCWDPKVKGLTVMVNSIYNGWRMEDVWLDH